MRKFFIGICGLLMAASTVTVFAGEDSMDWSKVNETVSTGKPYLEFHVNFGNTNGNDSYTTEDMTVTVNGTSWTVSNFKGDKAKDNTGEHQKWVYDNTKNGMRLLGGYTYKKAGTDDYYVKYMVYFDKVYDGQSISYSWSTKYCLNRGDIKAQSGSSTCKVSLESTYQISSVSTGNTSTNGFSATAKTPSSASETYTFYLLKEDRGLSEMQESDGTYGCKVSASATGGSKNMTVTVSKTSNSDLLLVCYYYPRYYYSKGYTITNTTTTGTTKFYAKINQTITSYPLNGSGTSGNPFLINTADELEIFRDLVNKNNMPALCALQKADIDMSGRNWLPIGRYTDRGECRVLYTGTYNGGGHIISNLKGSSSIDHNMGFVGRSSTGCVVKNLILNNVKLTGMSWSASFVGLAIGKTTVEYCGSYGTLDVGCGLVGRNHYTNVTLSYSFTTHSNFCSSSCTVQSSYCGNDVKNKSQTGELCYLLNGASNVNYTWKQNIGSDTIPQQSIEDKYKVFKTGVVYHNGELPFKGAGSIDDPFQIVSESNLNDFARWVNKGYPTLCAKLMMDIDYTAYKTTEDMIGTSAYPYSGVFNGNGKTLKIAFSNKEELTGLFRYTNGATILDFRLLGAVSGTRQIGSLIGVNAGSTLISHVISDVEVTSTYSGDAAAAGMVGFVEGTLTIDNSAFRGKLLGTTASHIGGFVGWVRGGSNKANISNSYFAPSEVTTGTDNSSTFVRYASSNLASITNCYYTTAYGTVQGTAVTDKQSGGGELCFLLNEESNNNATWLQTIGTDALPTLWDAQRVYHIGDVYQNYASNLPGAGTLADPYLIGSASDLEYFRDLVNKNKGMPSLCGRLTADIDMSDRNWLPIGRYTQNNDCRVSYTGTFNGDGFVIRNLSGRSEVDHDMGLIGRAGDGCTVRNLIMENVHLEGMYRCAPIIGLSTGEFKVENCGVFGVLKFAASKTPAYGGLVGSSLNQNSVLSNCYSVYSNLSGSGSVVTSNCYYGDNVKNMAATGELCYKLNGGTGTVHHWLQTIGTDAYPMQRTGRKVDYDTASKKYKNIDFSAGDNTEFSGDFSSNDLKIIHHGGQLYEFVITLASKDGLGAHAYPDVTLSYKENGSWIQIATLKNINRENLSFDGDWSGEIKIDRGTFYNPHTFETQTPVFWLMQGDQSTNKATSLLWMAPEGMEKLPKEFRIQTIDQTPVRSASSVANPTESSTETASITVVEPYIDASSQIPGMSASTVMTPNTAYSLGLWDATDSKFISTTEISAGATSVNILLPQQDCIHDIVAIMYTQEITMDGTRTDTLYVTRSVPFQQKPLHAIRRTNIKAGYNNTNELIWGIAFPTDSDLITGDIFDVYRAYKSDYSDASSIGSEKIEKFTSQTTENDSLIGWFSFRDTTEGGRSTSERFDGTKSAFDTWNLSDEPKKILTAYKYPERYIHYRVSRSSVSGIWGCVAPFSADWKVLLTNVLPRVDSIKVIKTDGWKQDHKVMLRLVLNNPYPADLVPAKYKDEVKLEADANGFAGGMFAWDENASIIIERYSEQKEWYQGVDEVAEKIVVKGSEVKTDPVTDNYYVLVPDIQSAPMTHYYYKARVDNSTSNYPICTNMTDPVYSSKEDANACWTEGLPQISNFTATRGVATGLVNLSWDADYSAGVTYSLQKIIYEIGFDATEGDSAKMQKNWKNMSFDGSSAADDEAMAGVTQKYELKNSMKFRGQIYESTAVAYGSSRYDQGKVSGHVRMPNGTAMPGSVTVTLKPVRRLYLKTVTTPDGMDTVMIGYQRDTTVIEVPCDENGYYHVDSLCYYGSGIQYVVSAHCSGATFMSSSGTSASMTVTLEDAQYEYSDIDFVCNDVHQFSGRILYDGSTVPVRGIEFLVNSHKLVDTDGNPIVTDATGNFSFTVPKFDVQIQAVKQGHILTGDGFILGGPKRDQKRFTPTEDYDGLTLTDSTKIRLVGRVAAGETEGSIPVGFGKSNNNLGDNITLVLELEGDKTSYLYYNLKNPEDSGKDAVFTQTLTARNSGGSEEVDRTDVSFQRKRIVVKADNKTGEFCLDLYPARYKISQIYAEGYSTLYNIGEGAQVLDLTDSTSNIVHGYTGTGLATSYCASYNRIYHAPVKLLLTQKDGNSTVSYYGASKIAVVTANGRQELVTAWQDSSMNACYTFGSPVFEGGTKYNFTATAREEYHYNNVSTGKLTTAPVGNHKLTISNGLTSGSPVIEKWLNAAGKADFSLTPSNTTFSFTGEDALFTLSASVDVNGYSYGSEPVKAYVTGSREMGVEVEAALESTPQVMDIIRDPYGAESYAWREAGTSYTWSQTYNREYQEHFLFDLTAGIAFMNTYGIGVGNSYNWYVPLINLSLDKTTEHEVYYKDGNYTVTFTDRIQTSADPHDVGAMADLYIGTVSTCDIRKHKVFSLFSEEDYKAASAAIVSGAVRVVASGADYNSKKNYLVITDGYSVGDSRSRMFIYSQKYILGTLIPNLEKKRDEALRVADSEKAAQKFADLTGRNYYYKNDTGGYVAKYPTGSTIMKDSVNMYNTRIAEWRQVISDNEEAKVKAMEKTPDKSYSLSGSTVERTETASTYYTSVKMEAPTPYYYDIGGGFGGNQNDSGGGNRSDQNKIPDQNKGLGMLFKLYFGGSYSQEVSNVVKAYRTEIAGSGYHLSLSGNSYIDMDVYIDEDSTRTYLTADSTFEEKMISYLKKETYKESEQEVFSETEKIDDSYTVVSLTGDSLLTSFKSIHNYIFVQRGGASRSPWTDADSTLCYQPNGVGEPLGSRTLRIDNPKIYVENPIVENQPQDEKAVFTIRLANETEINAQSKYLNPSTLYLNVDEASNPDGAKITVDGAPVRNTLFYLNPGQSVVKTLCVERGGKPYDYDNLKLQFTDDPNYCSVMDEACISVHYLPNSTPVNLSLPADNWLINTLSQVDEDGNYYIPVQIDGFSTTQYDNFDHIELQYKRVTDSEDQWVNLCSYYADEALYKSATCTKAMITTADKITNIRFYGEKDPVEMKYDLRAVSFCRLGTGYVTRYSKVVSGTKDTRCPEVFGYPEPREGILGFNDVITLPFTEPIAYNYLDETVNFSVTGYTNETGADHSTALYFPGTKSQEACTQQTLIANCHDFTIEMMVKVEGPGESGDKVSFLSLSDSSEVDDNLEFGYYPGADCLFANISGTEYKSVALSSRGLNLSQAMTHVALTYCHEDSTVSFYVVEEEVAKDAASAGKKCSCTASGNCRIGDNLKGSVSDARVWSKVLTDYEIASKYRKTLSVGEKNLMGYWPMDEAAGEVAADKINGLDLYLTDVAWQTPAGYSVRLEGKPLLLNAKGRSLFTREGTEDYSLAFWFRTDAGKDIRNVDLFSAGSNTLGEIGLDKMRIGLENGSLFLRSEGNTIDFDVTDETSDFSVWHQVAVTVNHSQNTAGLYFDGVIRSQVSAELLGGITGSYIAFGDSSFYGNIDDISVWGVALPATSLAKQYNVNLSGKEMELLVNLDFEQTLVNSQGAMCIGFSPLNNVIVASTGEISGDSLIVESEVTQDDRMYAPVRSGSTLQNLPFTWKSTDSDLQIVVNKADADINHQQLYFVVREVEDLSGNPMKNAQMWSVYVDKNVLKWNESYVSLVLPYGHDTTVVATFENSSGRSVGWTVESDASWLSLVNTKGTVEPLSKGAVALQITDGLAPGTYMTDVYLEDEDNLVSSIRVLVVVRATEPEWQVSTNSDYTETMNVVGIVKKKGKDGTWRVDMSPTDVVAAFIDNVCVGKSNLKVDLDKGTSYLLMTVRGKNELQYKPVEFRLWNARDGQIYILETDEAIRFQRGALIGGTSPVEMRTSQAKVQSVSLNEGWNWVSFNVEPYVGTGINDLLSDKECFTEGDIIKHQGTSFSLFNGTEWDNGLDDMEIVRDNVYQIYVQNPSVVTVCGTEIEDSNRYVTLRFGSSDWAEMAYLLTSTYPINMALSDFLASSKKAPAGTVVKNRESFAVARSDGYWFGSLEYMRPGEGYYVYRNGLKEDVVVHYYESAAYESAATKASFEGIASSGGRALTKVVGGYEMSSEYSESMPIIAALPEGTYSEGDVIVALVNGDIAGKSKAFVDERTGQLYFFLSVQASAEAEIRFVKVREGKVTGESRQSLTFNGNSVAGTLESPYLIDFSEPSVEGIYDLKGISYPSEEYIKGQRGVFILNGEKKLR